MNALFAYIDRAASFNALARMNFDDMTAGDWRELHDMARAGDLVHVDDDKAVQNLIADRLEIQK